MSQLLADTGKEAAFIGRSNAGKSSVINALTRRRNLAVVSKTPGRTRQLNFFSWGTQRRLVDLPGYGYARAPAAMKRDWRRFVNAYLAQRRSLAGLVLIVDIRRGLGDLDERILDWCAAEGRPAHILLNKADKLSRGAARRALQEVDQRLAEPGAVQLFSATRKHGLDELTEVLRQWLR